MILAAVLGIATSQIIYGVRHETLPAIERELTGEEMENLKRALIHGGETMKTFANDPETHEVVVDVLDAYWEFSPTRMAGQALKDLCYENIERCVDTVSKPWRGARED